MSLHEVVLEYSFLLGSAVKRSPHFLSLTALPLQTFYSQVPASKLGDLHHWVLNQCSNLWVQMTLH